MNRIELRYTYTEAEQVRAAQLYYESVMRIRRDAVIVGGLLLVGGVLGVLGGYPVLAEVLVALSVLALAAMGFVYFVRPRQMFRTNPAMRNEFHLVFHDDGIHLRTKNMDSHIGWDLYQAVLRDRDIIALLHGTRTMTVIPVRAFADSDLLSRFGQMAARHIPNGQFQHK